MYKSIYLLYVMGVLRCDCLAVFSPSSCSLLVPSAVIPLRNPKDSSSNMADKISDDHPSPMGNTKSALDNQEKTIDSEKQALQSKDADAALEFLYAEETTLMTDVDEKSLVRKIDWRIAPLMCRSFDIKGQVAIQLNKKILRGLLQPPVSRQDTRELCQRNAPGQYRPSLATVPPSLFFGKFQNTSTWNP